MGTSLKQINIGSEEPKPEDQTVTAVNDMWIFTASLTDGVIKDTCKGDSGGPLVVHNGGQPVLIGVLNGEGYDCETNTFNGDGRWSNVVSQRDWVLGHISGSITGEISLRGELRPSKLGGQITKGNVYLDGHPICDNGWSVQDATVACRML